MIVLPILGSIIPVVASQRPWVLVCGISVVTGLLMLMIFRYTSDQKAIRRAKDRLKAHLLAVRLFRDQLPVVLSSYWQIVVGTGTYLRYAFRPLLIVIIPMFFVIVHLDRYFGWVPIEPQQPFLLQVQGDKDQTLDDIELHLPPEVVSTAPAVHIPIESQIVWQLAAAQAGEYNIDVIASGQKASKNVVVSQTLSRVSPLRMRGNFWERMLSSNEEALRPESHIEAISINYPEREINFAGWQWNWIVLFFVLSLAAGFIFKLIFRIEI